MHLEPSKYGIGGPKWSRGCVASGPTGATGKSGSTGSTGATGPALSYELINS